MVFNSYIFVLVFLPLTLAGYFGLHKTNHSDIAKGFLLLMSLWFYAYFDIRSLPLLLISIEVNFLIVRYYRPRHGAVLNKLLLGAGLLFNLGLLFYFKYLGFFAENMNRFFHTSFPVANILLPLGISFFTFQQIAFVVDGYRGQAQGYRFLDYALFVSFFPKINMGPIALHQEILPQLSAPEKWRFSYENFSRGLTAFAFGMAKKSLLADMLGLMVDWGYDNIPVLGTTNGLLVMLAYTLQIYFDFSGYCDMASGISLMLNIELPVNFISPYKALSVDDFWKRWHITLTRFFRTYIYFPLGGSRKGKVRTYVNMFLIFFISGLWHGASWTFIIWGAMHGFGIVLSKLLHGKLSRVPACLKWLVTFAFINVTWIYFRAGSISQANNMLQQIFSLRLTPVAPDMVAVSLPAELKLIQYLLGILAPAYAYQITLILLLLLLAVCLFIVLCTRNVQERLASFSPDKKTAAAVIFLLVWSVMSLSSVSTFLYVNF